MKKILITLFLFLVSTSICAMAQTQPQLIWEYEKYPDLPFVLHHTKLELNIEKDASLIKGVGRFEISSRRPDLTQVVFNTLDLDIREISVGGNALDFHVSMDSLIIQLPDTLHPEDRTELLISWESSSPYGINYDIYGNFWTSLNPKSRHHWIPLPDHPEIATTLEASITIPAEEEVIFNGAVAGDEVISTEERTVQWASETTIPVSGISLALGDFVRENARSGVKQVSIYASENSLLEEVRSGLLSTAVSALKEYEEKLSFEFPYEALHIVVLPDHHWEEIQTGAGIVFLYQNLGSLSTQLRRGIAEQWFGNYHRYLDAPDNKYEFLKALVTGTSETEQLKNPDELQSIYRWNLWERELDFLEDEYLKSTIKESLPDLIRSFEGVADWNEYAAFWYDKTGIFWENLPHPQRRENSEDEEYIYNVEYLYDERNSTLTLIFEADNRSIETLVGVDVTEYGFSDTTRSEISFTGDRDSIEVNISSGIEYLTLSIKPDVNVSVKLIEAKPFMFLISQLRSPNASHRIQAAKQLQNYTDNPDLQLALQDVLREEENPEVRAALLGTLSEITKSASGTEQTFIEQLTSDNLSIRLSSIRALSNYPGNEQVAYSIQNVLLNAEKDTVFNTALGTYQKVAETGELLSVVERLERAEGGDKKALQVLKVAARTDTSQKTLTIADRYALGNFPFAIRRQAIELLLTHESNQDYWNQTLEILQEDCDPRIRYISLDGVKHLSSKQTVELLVERSNEEMDPRVLGKIRNLMRRAEG